MTDSYIDQLTLELRRRDVPGTRIGEVIAEVEAHVAESGDRAAEAFGPPSEYAQRVSDTLRPPPAEADQPRWLRYARLYAVGIGAFLLAQSILIALGIVSPSATVSMLVAAALLPLSALVVVGRLMRPDPGPRLVTWLIVAAAVAVPIIIGALPLSLTLPGLPWPVLLAAQPAPIGARAARAPGRPGHRPA